MPKTHAIICPRLRITIVLTLFLGFFPVTARSVDGLIEINQARALAGGVTTGDSPGFPITISVSDSYILTGNLSVPDSSTTAILLTTNDVTIDLNGFGILGAASSTDSGEGISGSLRSNIEVRNGTIRGMGADGVRLGNRARLRDLRLSSNGDGLNVGVDSLVVDVTSTFNRIRGMVASSDTTFTRVIASENGEYGMDIGTDSSVLESRVNDNGRHGIIAGGGNTILKTTLQGNEDFGIFFSGGGSGYGWCVINDNNSSNSNPQVSGGIELTTNICGLDTTCP